MKKDDPKAQARSGVTISAKERAFWTTGDPTLDFEIVKETVKGVVEGGIWVYEWLKGQSPLVVYVVNSRSLNKHHIVTFTLRNISPHGVYIEDITLEDTMQVVAFQEGVGEPRQGVSYGHVQGKWVLDTMSANPAPPFSNTPLCPVFIPSLGTFSFNCAIQSSRSRKWATMNFIIAPLSEKKLLKHPEVFRLRDR